MGQFNAQSVNPLFQPDNISKNEATNKLKNFIKSLDSLSQNTSQNFKPELVNLLKETSFVLKSFMDSPQQNTPKLMQASEKLLNYLAEANPELLESNIDELNQIKKKNKKSPVTELLQLKNAIIAGFSKSEASNQSSKITSVKTDFSSKLRLFSRLNAEPKSMTIESKTEVLESFGFTNEEASTALTENNNLFNALISLLPNNTNHSSSAQANSKENNLKDINISELNPNAPINETDKNESKKMAIEILKSHLVKNESNKLHDAFLNLESSTQSITQSTPKQIEEILAKDYGNLTLGDLNALEIYYTELKQTKVSATNFQSSFTNEHKMYNDQLEGLIISSQNKPTSLDNTQSKTHPMLKLVADFSPEEIEALIKSLLENGIATLDDLTHILSLLSELGLSASPALLAEINSSVQDYIDNLSSTITDPLQLLQIISTISQISQGDLTEEINMDKVGAKMSQLILNTSTSNEAKQIINAAESLPIHLNITPVNVDEDVENTTPNLFSQQAAGALNQQTTQKKSQIETSQIVPNTSQKVSQINSVQKSSASQNNSNQNDSQEMASNKINKKGSGQTQEEIESLFEKLESLVEKTEPELINSLLVLMGDIYKKNLNTTLDDTLDAAFNKLNI